MFINKTFYMGRGGGAFINKNYTWEGTFISNNLLGEGTFINKIILGGVGGGGGRGRLQINI